MQQGTIKRSLDFWVQFFNMSAAVILAVTGLAKIWSSLGNAKLLAMTDPILDISFQHLLAVTGVVELVIATICFARGDGKFSLALVAWLTTGFTVYRIGLWSIGWHRPCSCLGTLTDALHIRPELADDIMKCILLYLLTASYVLLFWFWKKDRKNTKSQTACGRPVESSS